MYNVNDDVLYGIHGVCRIAEIEERELAGEKIEYYVLKPVFNEKATIFIPTDNEELISKMRKLLSPSEIYSLIKTMPDECTNWIDNELARKEYYKDVLLKGDPVELIRLIKTLYLHQQKQNEHGRKLHVADEHFLKDAEKILYDEFAYVLNLEHEQVLPFIMEQISINEGE